MWEQLKAWGVPTSVILLALALLWVMKHAHSAEKVQNQDIAAAIIAVAEAGESSRKSSARERKLEQIDNYEIQAVGATSEKKEIIELKIRSIKNKLELQAE